MDLERDALDPAGDAVDEAVDALANPTVPFEADASIKISSEQEGVFSIGDGTESAVESEDVAKTIARPEIINRPREGTPYALSGGEVTEVFPESSGMSRVFRAPGHPLTYARRRSPPASSENTRDLVSRVLHIAALLTLVTEIAKETFVDETTEELDSNPEERSRLRTLLINLLDDKDEPKQGDEEDAQERTSRPLIKIETIETTEVTDATETTDGTESLMSRKKEAIGQIARSQRVYVVDTDLLLDAMFPNRAAESRQIEELGEGNKGDNSDEGGKSAKKKKKRKSKKNSKKQEGEHNPIQNQQLQEEQEGRAPSFPSESPRLEKGKGKAVQQYPSNEDQDIEEGRERSSTIVSESSSSETIKGDAQQELQEHSPIEHLYEDDKENKTLSFPSKPPKSKKRKGKARHRAKIFHPVEDRHHEEEGTIVTEFPDMGITKEGIEQQSHEAHPTEDQHLGEGENDLALHISEEGEETTHERQGLQPTEDQRLEEREIENTLTSTSKSPDSQKGKRKGKQRVKGTVYTEHQRSEQDPDVASAESGRRDGKGTPKTPNEDVHATAYELYYKEEQERAPDSASGSILKKIEEASSSNKDGHSTEDQLLEREGETVAAFSLELPKSTKSKKKARKDKKSRPHQQQHIVKTEEHVEEPDEEAPSSPPESSKIIDIETPLDGLEQSDAVTLRTIDPHTETTPEAAEVSSPHDDLPGPFSAATDGSGDTSTGQHNSQDIPKELARGSNLSQSGNVPKPLDDHTHAEGKAVSQISEEPATEDIHSDRNWPTISTLRKPVTRKRSPIRYHFSLLQHESGWCGVTRNQNKRSAMLRKSKSLTEVELKQFIVAGRRRYMELVTARVVDPPVQSDQVGSRDDDIDNGRSDHVSFLRERTVSRSIPSGGGPLVILRRDSTVPSQYLTLNAPGVDSARSGLDSHVVEAVTQSSGSASNSQFRRSNQASQYIPAYSAGRRSGKKNRQDIRVDEKDITANVGWKSRMNPLAKAFVPASEPHQVKHSRGEQLDWTTEHANVQGRSVKGDTTRPPQTTFSHLKPSSSLLRQFDHHNNLINQKMEHPTTSYNPQQSTADTSYRNTTGSSEEMETPEAMEIDTVSQEQTEPADTDGGLATAMESMSIDNTVRQSENTNQAQHPVETSASTVRPNSPVATQGESSSQSEDERLVTFADLDLKCAWCEKRVVENDPTTILCNGCGPYSKTRYCTEQHLFFDLSYHWELCNGVSLPFHVDKSTLPAHYNDYCPAIENRHGVFNYYLLRQRAWSTYRHEACDYAVFSDCRQSERAGFPVQTIIPIQEICFDHTNGTRDIVNRILNLCFLDHQLIRPALLLYRIIRMALRDEDRWDTAMEREVNGQFWSEFKIDAPGMTHVRDSDQDIWNEWSGSGGVEAVVDYYEARHPLLRYWRREHPEVKNGWDRFWGVGYPDALEVRENGFSAGWNGHGGDTRPWEPMVPVLGD